jgi:hypothetical protein
MNSRLTTALHTASILAEPDTPEKYKQDGETRLAPTMVPIDFVRMKSRGVFSEIEERAIAEGTHEGFPAYANAKLSECMNSDGGTNFLDLFAQYYSGENRVRKAIAETGGTTYFPRFDHKTGEEIKPGYREGLPEYQRRLIERASAIYLITLEDGGPRPMGTQKTYAELQNLREIESKKRWQRHEEKLRNGLLDGEQDSNQR